MLGDKCFYFGFYPDGRRAILDQDMENPEIMPGYNNFNNKGFEPYINGNFLDGDNIYANKKNYTKAIQLNGWKIPDDYPIKF